MYVIVAEWHAQPGSGSSVIELLQEMMVEVAHEPGCALYACNQDPADPDHFMLYEQYIDEQAFQAHLETEAFKRIVLAKIVPLLVDRHREIWQTIDH